MPLNRADRSAIQRLDRKYVETTLRGMSGFLKNKKFLHKANSYAGNAVGQINADMTTGGIRHPKDLAQYISISSLLHCADGWSYLGKSVYSLLLGDPHRARHLAYYAELRAATSILAAQGVGIFNNRHFIVDAANSVKALERDRGTHQVVWECLDYWVQQRRSGGLLTDVIRPYGRSLEEWLTPLGGTSALGPQAQRWFQCWGMDVALGAKDRDARNESSYRPDGLPNSWSIPHSEVLNFTTELWQSLQPTTNSVFEEIDRHLLRLSIENIFTGRYNTLPAKNHTAFYSLVDKILDHQSIYGPVREGWKNFLIRKTEKDDLSIIRYSIKDPLTTSSGCFSVLSRACLLLRISSGSWTSLSATSGLTTDLLSFWGLAFGETRGLWSGATGLDELFDLWADVEPALEELQAFQQSRLPIEQNCFSTGNVLGRRLLTLANFERVAVWSLLPA